MLLETREIRNQNLFGARTSRGRVGSEPPRLRTSCGSVFADDALKVHRSCEPSNRAASHIKALTLEANQRTNQRQLRAEGKDVLLRSGSLGRRSRDPGIKRHGRTPSFGEHEGNSQQIVPFAGNLSPQNGRFSQTESSTFDGPWNTAITQTRGSSQSAMRY